MARKQGSGHGSQELGWGPLGVRFWENRVRGVLETRLGYMGGRGFRNLSWTSWGTSWERVHRIWSGVSKR